MVLRKQSTLWVSIAKIPATELKLFNRIKHLKICTVFLFTIGIKQTFPFLSAKQKCNTVASLVLFLEICCSSKYQKYTISEYQKNTKRILQWQHSTEHISSDFCFGVEQSEKQSFIQNLAWCKLSMNSSTLFK